MTGTDYKPNSDPTEKVDIKMQRPIDLITSQVELLLRDTNDEDHILDLIVPVDVLLSEMGLIDKQPDGRTMLSRLFSDQRPDREGIHEIRSLLEMLNCIFERIRIEDALSHSEEEVLRNLSFVLDRQLVREGSICPIASELASKIAFLRPDYLSDEAKFINLHSGDPMSMIVSRLEEMPEIFDFIQSGGFIQIGEQVLLKVGDPNLLFTEEMMTIRSLDSIRNTLKVKLDFGIADLKGSCLATLTSCGLGIPSTVLGIIMKDNILTTLGGTTTLLGAALCIQSIKKASVLADGVELLNFISSADE